MYRTPRGLPVGDLREVLERKRLEDRKSDSDSRIKRGPPPDPPSILTDPLRDDNSGQEPRRGIYKSGINSRGGRSYRGFPRRRPYRAFQPNYSRARQIETKAPNIIVEYSTETGERKCTVDEIERGARGRDSYPNRRNFRRSPRGRARYNRGYGYDRNELHYETDSKRDSRYSVGKGKLDYENAQHIGVKCDDESDWEDSNVDNKKQLSNVQNADEQSSVERSKVEYKNVKQRQINRPLRGTRTVSRNTDHISERLKKSDKESYYEKGNIVNKKHAEQQDDKHVESQRPTKCGKQYVSQPRGRRFFHGEKARSIRQESKHNAAKLNEENDWDCEQIKEGSVDNIKSTQQQSEQQNIDVKSNTKGFENIQAKGNKKEEFPERTIKKQVDVKNQDKEHVENSKAHEEYYDDQEYKECAEYDEECHGYDDDYQGYNDHQIYNDDLDYNEEQDKEELTDGLQKYEEYNSDCDKSVVKERQHKESLQICDKEDECEKENAQNNDKTKAGCIKSNVSQKNVSEDDNIKNAD